MSLDGQVLVIALFAVALKLFLWSKEDVVRADMESDRKDVLQLDDSGLRLPGRARLDGAEDMVPASLRPRSDR